MSWPTYPTDENPYFGDGQTYGDELGRVSPEGNLYGDRRRLRFLESAWWWTGEKWVRLKADGEADSVSGLPEGPLSFGVVWRVLRLESTGQYVWDYYFWDSEQESWQPIDWYWTAQSELGLPIPAYKIGQAHLVRTPGVTVWWNGYAWVREGHKQLANDEPERHLPQGFLQFLTPLVEVSFASRKQIEIRPVTGDGSIVVAGEKLIAGPERSVFHNLPTLDWDGSNITTSYMEPDTEYWIYLAGTKNSLFSVAALPGNNDHNATLAWDFRGKLFLSQTDPVDGYWGETGAGAEAKIAGKIQTDSSGKEEGGPFFRRELDISLIDRSSSLPESFRDFSDFVIMFMDEDTLRLERLDGAYGQMYIPNSLVYLGQGMDIDRGANRVTVNETTYLPELDTTAIQASKTYYIYISNNEDTFNFNEVNPNTNRPWRRDDEGSAGEYDATIDLRLRPFLSLQTPDHGRLTESWPGFYTRHIGQVRTDANGLFLPSTDISSIRQPVLNPTHFDGLAEVRLQVVSTTQIGMRRAKGTSGIVLVAGHPVQTYDETDENAHVLNNSDTVYTYNEEEITAPLETTGHNVSYYAQDTLYVYLANNEECWGSLAGKLFASTDAPTSGYLSANWPGSNARWVARLVPDINGEFTGSCIAESIGQTALLIADTSVSTDTVWSSQKLQNELAKIKASISAGQLFEDQKTLGLSLILEMVNTTTIKLRSIYSSSVIAFGDFTTREITEQGLTLALSGAAGHKYVYLESSSFYLSTDPPTEEYAKLELKSTDPKAILVGEVYLTSTGAISGNWNVCSSHNEPIRQWTSPVTEADMVVYQNLVATKRCGGSTARTGTSYLLLRVHGLYWNSGNPTVTIDKYTYAAVSTGSVRLVNESLNPWVSYYYRIANHYVDLWIYLSKPTFGVGVHSGTWLTHDLDAVVHDWHMPTSGSQSYFCYTDTTVADIYAITGDLVIARQTVA